MPAQTQTPLDVSFFRIKLLKSLKTKKQNIPKQRKCSENQSWICVKYSIALR